MNTIVERMTGEEFLRLYGDRDGFELADGHLVRLPMPGFEHGEICGNAYFLIREFVKPRRLGRVFTNDPFIRTRTNPAGFRGADVVYISYESLPETTATPKGSFTPPLELAIEVRSPFDSLAELADKASEYLSAGVKVVLVLDPEVESAAIFRLDENPLRLHNGDELTLPDILPGFAVPVKRFFE